MQGKRWVLRGREKLYLESFAPRIPGPHELLIQVMASGLNFADAMMIKGLYPDAPAYPFTPGYEVSGIVIELGEQVQGFKLGDHVMAGCYFEGMASHATVAANQCALLPANLTLETGASVVVSFLTAWLALSEYARARPGDHVLVDCASGALGSMIARLGKKTGVILTGLTSSAHKCAQIQQNYQYAYTHEDFEQTSGKYDVIIQSRGGPTFHSMLRRLRPGGRIVALGVSDLVASNSLFERVKAIGRTLWGLRPIFPASLMNGNYGVFGLNVLHLFKQMEVLERGLQELAASAPEIPVAQTFDYSQLEEAFKQILSRSLAGKVLLSWGAFHAS